MDHKLAVSDGDFPTRGEPYTRPAWVHYVVAVGIVLVAALGRAALTPFVGPTALPFIFFFPAVALATWLGGLGPGILSVTLATLLADWFFIEPTGSLTIYQPMVLGAFLVSSIFIVGAIAALRRMRTRLFSEIAARKRGNTELERARDILSTTLESIGDGVIVTDAQGRITFLNAEAERLTGWKIAEAAGRPLPEVFRVMDETIRKPIENPVDRVLREGTVVGLANHTLLLDKAGAECPIDDSAAPIRRPGGPIFGVVLVFRDATEQRAAAEARSRLAAIVDSSGDAIISKNLEGTIQTWNAAAERLFGYTQDEILGKPITCLVPEELMEEETQILERIRYGHSVRLDTTRVTKDGRRLPVSIRISPVRDRDGGIVGASKILHDRTAFVAAQEALAREKELLSRTLASIGDAVIATDAQGRVIFLNAVAELLTGWKESDAMGRPLSEVFRILNEKTRREVENPALRAMRDGVIVGLANHTILISKSGDERPIDDSAAPISIKNEVVGSVLVFRDVTERRRAEEKLRANREQLERQAEELLLADRRKNDFLAMLAHELRNPLAPIRNSITVLQMKGPPDPELVWAREVIERQVTTMARLLDDLLDLNRLARQKLELRKEAIALETVIERAVETSRPLITSGRQDLRIDLPKEPLELEGDPIRLAQVFSNLLNNAAKYTDPGGQITIKVMREDESAVVTVRDTGIGIEPEALPRIFEIFSQVPSARNRSEGGAGIGLSLANGIVVLHGGTIEARSAGLGKGSEFSVRLPLSPASRVLPQEVPKREPIAIRTTATRRVLIADDLRDSTDSLAMMLRTVGHTVETAYDGEQALQSASKWRPEVLLLDIGMPKLDGYGVCRRIRAEPWGETIFIIAQTGWGQESDLRLAREAGFDHYLVKPVSFPALLDVLARLEKDGREGWRSKGEGDGKSALTSE